MEGILNGTKQYYKKHKLSILVLAIALCAILVSSFFAAMFQSSFFSVAVTELNDVTNVGTMEVDGERITNGTAGQKYNVPINGAVASGTLFMPRGASKTSKRAGIVLTHGYLNNKELQLQNAIELARRGFIVLAIDRGGHGNNQLASDTSALTNTAGMYDAAKYLHNLPECDGVGISGHSMGGYTTAVVLASDAKNNSKIGTLNASTNAVTGAAITAQNGLGIVKAGLIQGWDTFMGAGADVSVGILKAKDDEFFFKSTLSDGTPSICRQYLLSTGAASFIGTTTINVLNGSIYIGGSEKGEYTNGKKADSAFRVIYETDEIHPVNHFSIPSAAAVSNFFYTAFGVPANSSYIGETNQIWWIKEAFSFVGLIAFFAMLLPIVDLLLTIPLFASLRAKKDEQSEAIEGEQVVSEGPRQTLAPLKGVRKHISYWVAGALTTLFSGFSIRWVMAGGGWLNWIVTILFTQGRQFPQDTTGRVAAWAITCGLFAIIITAIIFVTNRIIDTVGRDGQLAGSPFGSLRIDGGLLAVLKTILLGAITVTLMYLVVFINWEAWVVDFRIWTLDVQPFEVGNMLPMMIRYMVPFFIFYLINSMFNQNYKTGNLPEWATIAINAFFNIFGIVLVIVIQYITFRSTGVLWLADMNLNYIVLIPIIPILVIATIYSRRLYERTGNAWLGGVINAILFTVITCANTASSFVYGGFFS